MVTSSVVGRHPNGSWASRRVTVSRTVPCSPQRRHHESSSVIRQANTARSVCRRWPVTSSPSSSRRQKVVKSAQAKPAPLVASCTSRSSLWRCENSHLRKTSTLIPATTRPPALHPQLRRASIGAAGNGRVVARRSGRPMRFSATSGASDYLLANVTNLATYALYIRYETLSIGQDVEQVHHRDKNDVGRKPAGVLRKDFRVVVEAVGCVATGVAQVD